MKITAVLASIVLLWGCTQNEDSVGSSSSNTIYHSAPPIHAAQLAGDKSCGVETHLLLDDQGTEYGVAEIIHSRSYLFVDVVPSAPWLVSEAAATVWASAPTSIDPDGFLASRSVAPPEEVLSLWMPLPEELVGAANKPAYVAVRASIGNGEEVVTIQSYDLQNEYVSFTVCVYPPISDPEDLGTSENSGISEDAGTSSADLGTSAEELPVSSSEPVVISSAVEASSETVAQSSSSWDLCGKVADGRTIGFWKNNITKYIAGVTRGTQVSADEMAQYLEQAGMNADEALEILSSTSGKAEDLLRKQLVGSQFNFARGAYLDGDEALTRAFLEWGLSLPGSGVSDAEYLAAKDLFDAYNNSHGGAVAGECKL